MPTGTYGVNIQVGGVSISKSTARTGNHENTYSVVLPIGTAGTLTTRTDNDTGVITVASHSITASDTVDVYWSGGMRYGVDVTATTGTTISIDIGSGDNLPAASTAVVVTKQVSINTAIDGDAIVILGILAEYSSSSSTAKAHIDMLDAGAATIEEIDLAANVPAVYDVYGGATNVFTGNVITVSKASNGSATEEATLKIACLDNA